jgi:hypothetical protein
VFSSEQVFTEIYKLGNYFPLAFAAIAVGIAVAGFLNARFAFNSVEAEVTARKIPWRWDLPSR